MGNLLMEIGTYMVTIGLVGIGAVALYLTLDALFKLFSGGNNE
jgi:hypothetical protein